MVSAAAAGHSFFFLTRPLVLEITTILELSAFKKWSLFVPVALSSIVVGGRALRWANCCEIRVGMTQI